MKVKRRYRAPIAFVSVFVCLLLGEVNAFADGAESIRLICEARWSNKIEAQDLCQESQTSSANELMRRIEHASESSRSFLVARLCIEKSKIQPPFGIDWVQALACFNDRLVDAKAEDENSPLE